MGRQIQAAQENEDIKVIFIHGGLFFCSGNDLAVLSSNSDMPEDEKINAMSYGVEHTMVVNLFAIHNSKKPIVGLIRGQAIGIGFTTAGLFDFIYMTPEVTMSTPFMKSC